MQSGGLAPRWASAPGETVTAAMDERQIPLEDLATSLGLPVDEARMLLRGELSLTVAIARGLAGFIGGSTEFWLTREAQYHDDLARVQADKWSQGLPVSQMVTMGWIDKPASWLDQIDVCLRFFDVTDVEAWSERYDRDLEVAHFRSSQTLDLKAGATTAWFRAGELVVAERNVLPAFDATGLAALVPDLRALTRIAAPELFIGQLVAICANVGVHVAVVPAPTGCPASGVARLVDGHPLIQLSGRHLTDDHFWFTFFHEVGHVLHHELTTPFIDILDEESTDQFEAEANDFASEILLGNTPIHSGMVTKRDVVRYARTSGVSPGIVVGQLQHRGMVRNNQLNGLKRRYIWDGPNLGTRRRS